MAVATTASKNRALEALAEALRGASHRERILAANCEDVDAGQKSGLAPAMLDRLRLDEARLEAMARGVAEVAALPDPVGAIGEMKRLPSGITAGRMRVPLGVIAIVYESRPNVTSDAAALCIKSGNAVILRGGSEAKRSNAAIAEAVREALTNAGLDANAVQLVPRTEREVMVELLGLTGLIDLVIPRGGEGLIRFVTEHARVPVLQHYKGVCHVYVDGDADPDMAERIVIDAKARRPGVCNAMETLLVDRAASAVLPRLVRALREHGVEVRGDEGARQVVPDLAAAADVDFDTEHLALVCSLALVDGIDGAIAHIARHGTNHTEAIVTRNYEHAQRFLREVDASLVLANASTRFNDGGQLGLGAEMGISTSKMHAYGAMGLVELCTSKWIAYGDGNVRG